VQTASIILGSPYKASHSEQRKQQDSATINEIVKGTSWPHGGIDRRSSDASAAMCASAECTGGRVTVYARGLRQCPSPYCDTTPSGFMFQGLSEERLEFSCDAVPSSTRFPLAYFRRIFASPLEMDASSLPSGTERR